MLDDIANAKVAITGFGWSFLVQFCTTYKIEIIPHTMVTLSPYNAGTLSDSPRVLPMRRRRCNSLCHSAVARRTASRTDETISLDSEQPT